MIEILDLSCSNINELKKQHKVFLSELTMYDKKLKDKIKLIILNKIDLCSFKNNIKEFIGIRGAPIISTSCVENIKIDELKKAIEII